MNFFASDGQDLPRLLASVPTDDSTTSSTGISMWGGKKSDLSLPYDTPLFFARRPPADGASLLVKWAGDDGSEREDGYYVCVLRGGQLYGDWEEPVPFDPDDDDWRYMNGDRALTETITIGAIAAERGHPTELWSYASDVSVKCMVPKPVPEWRGRSFYITKVLVKQEDGPWTQVLLKNMVRVKQVDNKLAIRPHLMDFSIRDSRADHSAGTDARDDGPWKKGSVGSTGEDIRPLITAEVFDEKKLVRVASKECVRASMYVARKGCHLRQVAVRTFNGHGTYHFGCRAETPAQAIYLCAVGAIGNILEHLKEENIEDSPYYQRLSQDLKDAARAAREGRPWKVQRLDDFKAPDAIGTHTYLVKGGGQRHRSRVGPNEWVPAPSAQKAFEKSQSSNPRCRR